MNTRRKPPKASLAHADVPKPLAPCVARDRSYPRLADLLREPALAGVLRSAVLGGAALSALALSGCEPPSCQPTRLGEVTSHGGQAVTDLTEFELKAGVEQLELGFGLSPHPASTPYMLGGAVAPTLPTVPIAPPPAPPSGPAGPAPTE